MPAFPRLLGRKWLVKGKTGRKIGFGFLFFFVVVGVFLLCVCVFCLFFCLVCWGFFLPCQGVGSTSSTSQINLYVI